MVSAIKQEKVKKIRISSDKTYVRYTYNDKNSKTNINSTYFYNENDSYRIPTRAGYISTIILSPDEDIIHAEIGDANRWSIQTYYTGTSRGMSPAISIKPFIPELKTNLVISTTSDKVVIVNRATTKCSLLVVVR